MSTEQPPSFGALLRQYRQVAGLTQEELAERAHLSRGAIDTLERGARRTPRKETLALLVEALALSANERAMLEASVRPRGLSLHSTSTSADTALDVFPLPRQEAVASLEEEAGGDADTEAMLSPLPSPPEGGSSRRSAWPSFAQVLGAWTHSPQLSGSALATSPGRALLLVCLLTALLGGGIFWAREPGLAALFGRSATAHGGNLCIASDFPTSGGGAIIGKSLQNAVQLAVVQNLNLGKGYSLNFVGYDDASKTLDQDPEQGARNVTEMARTSCIVGLVGPFSSFMAPPEMVIAANAGLAMISPGNTEPGLTLRQSAVVQGYSFDQLHPLGKKINYFRIPPNDEIQGKVDADVIIDQLPDGFNASSAYIVKDPADGYSNVVADGFSREFLAKGGTLLGADTLPLDTADHIQAANLASLVARIMGTRPQAVFYAGTIPASAVQLKTQLDESGFTGPFVGDDGIALDPAVVGLGNQTTNGILATLPATDVTTFTSGAAEQFIHDYAEWYPDQYLDGYVANAYDAAMILITAIRTVIRAGAVVTRAAVNEQVQRIRYAGVTGHIAFDHNGDNPLAALSLYTVRDGKWVFLKLVHG